MRAFLVRFIDDKELLGMFWANDKEALWRLVNEAAHPAYFEYQSLPEGGIFFSGTGPNPTKLQEERDRLKASGMDDHGPEHYVQWDGTEETERLFLAINEPAKRKWTPLAEERAPGVYLVLYREEHEMKLSPPE